MATVSPAETETVSPVSEQVAAVFTVPEALREQLNAVAEPFLYKVTPTVCADADAVGAPDAYSALNVHAAGINVCITA